MAPIIETMQQDCRALHEILRQQSRSANVDDDDDNNRLH